MTPNNTVTYPINEPLLQEQTIRYKTYLKRSLVEAFSTVFKNHPDPLIRQHTKIDVDLPMVRSSYPSVVVRFYERQIKNTGVGHMETLQNPSGAYQKYKHYMYTGDLEFAIYALSSYDRDLLSDSLVQAIAMSDIEWYTNYFYNRIYESTDFDSYSHFININTDQVSGFGETQVNAPWMAEDTLIYQSSYRVGAMGEFYNRMLNTEYNLVENIPLYPYTGVDMSGTDPVPGGDPNNTAQWEQDYFDPNLINNDQG